MLVTLRLFTGEGSSDKNESKLHLNLFTSGIADKLCSCLLRSGLQLIFLNFYRVLFTNGRQYPAFFICSRGCKDERHGYILFLPAAKLTVIKGGKFSPSCITGLVIRMWKYYILYI